MAIARNELGLPQEAFVLPPDRVESLQGLLPRIEAMRDQITRGDWPHFGSSREVNEAIPQFQASAHELLSALKPFKQDTGRNQSWGDALNFARQELGREMLARSYHTWSRFQDAVQGRIRDVDLGSVWNETKLWKEWYEHLSHTPGKSIPEVKDPAPDSFMYWLDMYVKDPFNAAKEAVVWEALKGAPRLNANPFLVQFTLYELGAVRTRFKVMFPEGGGTGEPVLTVDVPFSRDGKLLACLVFPEGREGDTEVKFYHRWDAQCDEGRPLSIPRRSLS